jgi:hypothetical protein
MTFILLKSGLGQSRKLPSVGCSTLLRNFQINICYEREKQVDFLAGTPNVTA